MLKLDFPGGSDSKNSACKIGDLCLIPGSGRSSGEGNVYPLQYSCLENSVDKRAWRATVHGVAKTQTQLSDNTFCSVQFSRSVVSNSLRPHELQHARPPCPSPTPRVYPNSCPLSRWCHPTILSSAIPFSSCPNLSQHQDLFKWVSSSHQVTKVLEFQLQHQSFHIRLKLK